MKDMAILAAFGGNLGFSLGPPFSIKSRGVASPDFNEFCGVMNEGIFNTPMTFDKS